VEGRSIMLEEYARQMVYTEELHAGEVDKMLRKSGEITTSGLDPESLRKTSKQRPAGGHRMHHRRHAARAAGVAVTALEPSAKSLVCADSAWISLIASRTRCRSAG
jgi:hypothetical protein